MIDFLVYSVIILIVVGFIYAIISLSRDAKKNEQIQQRRKNNFDRGLEAVKKEMTISKQYISKDSYTGWFIDENQKKICILSAGTPQVYNYRDILNVEVIEDGVTVSQTSRTSQVGGALLGAVLAGGVGAIIGGLSGKRTSVQEVNKIELKVIFNDTKQPTRTIKFLDSKKTGRTVPKTSGEYNRTIKNAKRWHSLVSVLIKQADEEDEKESSETNKTSDTPVSICIWQVKNV